MVENNTFELRNATLEDPTDPQRALMEHFGLYPENRPFWAGKLWEWLGGQVLNGSLNPA